MQKGRRAYAVVTYDGADISGAVSSDLLSLTYTDNSDKADDISITVQDREGNWAGPFYPKMSSGGGG